MYFTLSQIPRLIASHASNTSNLATPITIIGVVSAMPASLTVTCLLIAIIFRLINQPSDNLPKSEVLNL